MERHRQTFEEIAAKLSPIESAWQDDFAASVIKLLSEIPTELPFKGEDVKTLLEQDFDAALTVFRLFLDLSKDEFVGVLRSKMGSSGIGIKSFRADPEKFLAALESLGLREKMAAVVGAPYTWKDLLVERLKSGRGSAIKGQTRGKALEDFVEALVLQVFGKGNYDVRCRFVGSTGQSTEKADFAIPSKVDARILIEVKAYGATGSKLTDILGDMVRIVEEKRHDTTLLLVTDGVTWIYRASDLRKLIGLQNRGAITRIYTSSMRVELAEDLARLKAEHGL